MLTYSVKLCSRFSDNLDGLTLLTQERINQNAWLGEEMFSY